LAVFAIFFGSSAQKAFAISAPTDIPGLQLWLDASQPNSFYKDTAKTQPATLESDKIALWADKSGNGYDATNTNATNQPLLTLNKDGGYSGVQFGASANTLLTLGNPSVLNFGNTGSSTVFIVYKQTSSGVTYANLLHKGSSSNRAWWLVTSSSQVKNYGDGNYNFSSTTNSLLHGNVYEDSFTPDPNISTSGTQLIYLNGYLPSDGSPSAFNTFETEGAGLPNFDTTSVWNIGGDGSFLFNGYIQAVYIYNRALSFNEINNVNAYLASRFNIPWTWPLPLTNRVVYDGNSISAGGALGAIPFSDIIDGLETVKVPYVNQAVSGKTTSQLIVDAPTKVDPLFDSTLVNNILVGWEGTNEPAYTNLPTYYSARQAVGWENIAVTVLPNTENPSEVVRQATNASLRANYTTYAQALVDMGNDPVMGQAGQNSNTTYYNPDGTHQNTVGETVIANRIWPAIDALIHPLTLISNISTSTTASSAIIGWTSNASSSSIVDFDLTSNYSTSTAEQDNSSTTRKITGHSITVSGLQSCVLYHYRVRSNRLSITNDLVYLKNGTASSTDSTFITTGCTGNAAVSTSTSSMLTTASGGPLNLDTLSITVPTSFTSTSTFANFQIKSLDPTAFIASAGAPTSKSLVGNKIFNLKALTDATTTLPTFSQALTVTMSYVSGDITGILESSLKIYRYDGSSWTALTGCSVNTGAKTVTCSTSNFSDFGMYGDPIVAPSISTVAASPISTSTATLNASITSTGGADATQSGFAYGTSPTLATVIATTTLNGQTGITTFSQSFTGLTPNTTYYFRAYAVNSAGTSTGSILPFTTTDTTPPTVALTSPSGGSTVAGSAVSLSATASDDVAVAGVQFKLDSTTNIGSEITVAPYTTTWDSTAVSDGLHTIVAVARDNAGNYATSSLITVTVKNAVLPPAVTTSYSSSGGSASSQVNNLLAMGFYTQAQQVANQYGITIPAQNVPTQNVISVKTPSSNSGSSFLRTLKSGVTSSDVKKLQIFLNSQGFIVAKNGAGSPGHETTYFGLATKAALMKFQQAYKKEILEPQGLTVPTGFFGVATMNEVNALMK